MKASVFFLYPEIPGESEEKMKTEVRRTHLMTDQEGYEIRRIIQEKQLV